MNEWKQTVSEHYKHRDAAVPDEPLAPITMNEKDAAYYLGMSVAFLRQDRNNGHRRGRTPGPPYLKIGRSIRYLKSDLKAWLMEHRVNAPHIE